MSRLLLDFHCRFNGCACTLFCNDRYETCECCAHHRNFHAKGYWVGDELVILSSSRDLTVTIPEPSPLSAPISLEEYSARELKDVFGRVKNSGAKASSKPAEVSRQQPQTPKSAPGKPFSTPKAMKKPVTLLTVVPRVIFLRRNDPFPETPLALLKLKDYVVHNVSLTWSSLRACSEPMEDSESWRKMFLFSVGKKKKFECTGFSCFKFPESSEEIHALCSEETIVVCGSYNDTDYFSGADDDVTIVPNATVSTQEEPSSSSSSSSRASSVLVKLGSKRLGHFSFVY